MHVIFCCSTGITANLLVAKIRNELAARALDISISAEPLSQVMGHIDEADCILLAPQVSYALGDLTEATTKPIAAVDPDLFARADAPALADLIVSLLN